MNYPLNLTRAFFATITILLTVQISGGTDCTPTGTHVNDTVTGECSLNQMETTRDLTKKGKWNISWPDGHLVNSWTVTGTGKCRLGRECQVFFDNVITNCWPLFHQPGRSAAGMFSIRVDNLCLRTLTPVAAEVAVAAHLSVWEQAKPVAILLSVAAVCSALMDFVAIQKSVQGALY